MRPGLRRGELFSKSVPGLCGTNLVGRKTLDPAFHKGGRRTTLWAYVNHRWFGVAEIQLEQQVVYGTKSGQRRV